MSTSNPSTDSRARPGLTKALLRLCASAAGVVVLLGATPTQGPAVEFARMAGCEGKALPPWGKEKASWNAYLKAWNYAPKGKAAWRERGHDLGTRWLFEAPGKPPAEVLEKGGKGLGLVLSLGSWAGDGKGLADPAGLVRVLQGFCPPQGKPGCPEGGAAWAIPGAVLAVMFRPPAEEDGNVSESPAPGPEKEEEQELILGAYVFADVIPCGEDRP